MTYVALKRLKVGENLWREPGEVVPEAENWKNIRAWLGTYVEHVHDAKEKPSDDRRVDEQRRDAHVRAVAEREKETPDEPSFLAAPSPPATPTSSTSSSGVAVRKGGRPPKAR